MSAALYFNHGGHDLVIANNGRIVYHEGFVHAMLAIKKTFAADATLSTRNPA